MTDNQCLSLQARLQGLSNLETSLAKPISNPPDRLSNHAHIGARHAHTGRKSKIVIIARELLIRECLARCLQSSNGYAIESLAAAAEWIEMLATQAPPSFILLCALGRGHETEIEQDLRLLSEAGSKAPVVVFSNVDDINRVQAAFELGARGYIPTNVPLDVALSALRVVEVGGTFVPASSLFEVQTTGTHQISEPHAARLTPTQKAVGEAIRQGKANKQIAYELDMGESTVKVHIRNIMKKLNARNRTEVAVKIEDFCRAPLAAPAGG